MVIFVEKEYAVFNTDNINGLPLQGDGSVFIQQEIKARCGLPRSRGDDCEQHMTKDPLGKSALFSPPPMAPADDRLDADPLVGGDHPEGKHALYSAGPRRAGRRVPGPRTG